MRHLYQKVSLQKGHHVMMKDNIQEGLTRGQEQIFKGYVSKALALLDDVHCNWALCTGSTLFRLDLNLTLIATDTCAGHNAKLSKHNTKKCEMCVQMRCKLFFH